MFPFLVPIGQKKLLSIFLVKCWSLWGLSHATGVCVPLPLTRLLYDSEETDVNWRKTDGSVNTYRNAN